MKLDSRKWKRSAHLWLKYATKTDAKQFMEKEAGLYVKEVQALHPPGNENVSGSAAKAQGELAVENDLRRAFRPVADQAVGMGAFINVTDINAEHQSLRNSRGRIKKGLRKRRLVRQSDFNRQLAATKKKVGSLAAGMNESAGRTGQKPAAWIWRHTSPGSYTVNVSAKGIRIRMSNDVDWASGVEGLERHFQRALDSRARKLQRRVDNFLKGKARKAGFRVR